MNNMATMSWSTKKKKKKKKAATVMSVLQGPFHKLCLLKACGQL